MTSPHVFLTAVAMAVAVSSDVTPTQVNAVRLKFPVHSNVTQGNHACLADAYASMVSVKPIIIVNREELAIDVNA